MSDFGKDFLGGFSADTAFPGITDPLIQDGLQFFQGRFLACSASGFCFVRRVLDSDAAVNDIGLMMRKESAGLVMYRRRDAVLEVFLAHPGGPFWKNKDLGAWTVPKGEIEPGSDRLSTAQREFQEETGIQPVPPFHALGSITQKAGKKVYAWAFEFDGEPPVIRSNLVQMEWPPKSGKFISIPEIDRAEFFRMAEARLKINPAQAAFLGRLTEFLDRKEGSQSA